MNWHHIINSTSYVRCVSTFFHFFCWIGLMIIVLLIGNVTQLPVHHSHAQIRAPCHGLSSTFRRCVHELVNMRWRTRAIFRWMISTARSTTVLTDAIDMRCLFSAGKPRSSHGNVFHLSERALGQHEVCGMNYFQMKTQKPLTNGSIFISDRIR